jgi:tetratricopeptide (TPR) repeat protein
MDWQEIWDFVLKNSGAAGVVLVAGLALLGGLWKAYTHFFPKSDPAATTATEKIVHVLTGQLESANQREQEHRDQIRQLTQAVDALKVEGGKPDALPGIAEALEHLEQGETAAAEAVFEEVKARRKAEGEGAFKEAAAAARHIGALAFLHDTDKALAAYREAVALDPDDPDGWNSLGLLLTRTGNLDGAAEAYNRVLSLGNRTADQGLIAVATSNLGNFYMTRGELDRAEERYRMSLELNEALGRKEGMASDYSNLGTIYRTRVELDRAEEMYHKGLELFREVGAVPRIEQVEGWLAELREAE